MTKIKLSALACAILVGGGQQLVAEDLNIFIDLEHYDPIYVNKETKIITGASINVNNNEELIYRDSLFFHRTGINITNNSNATFENEVIIVNPNFHINDSTAVFNEKLEIAADSDFTQPVIEKDNDFSGGNLSLDNSTLDIKEEARFGGANVLINHGSTATIDNLANYASKIYVVNNSNLEINNKANFVRTHLIVKDDSNTTINGALEAENGAIVDDEIVLFDDGGIEIAKSNLNVAGEAAFYYYDIELNNSSNANFEDKLTLIADSAMLLKNGSTLNVGGEANFNNSVVELNNNSTATFENEVYMQNPNFHINNSTVVFNEKLEIQDGSGFWPVIEQDNDFSGGSLSLDNNSTLDIKKEAVFIATDVLINHGSTATIDNFRDYVSEIYVVNDSKLEINKDAEFAGTHLIVKDNSNTTINGALTVKSSNTIENGEYVVNYGGIKIDKSNLNVLGVADFTNSDLIVQNGSKVLFGNNFTMKNGGTEKSIIILDNGSEINIKGDFENHGVIYYGASADSAPKITVDGKATLKDTTEIGVYATSGLNQAVFLESKGAIENQATDENIYAMYFDPDNEDANEEGLVKYDQNIIDAVLNLSKDGKKLLVQILMSGDMQNKLINEKIDFIAKSTQAAGVNLTAQDLDIITSLLTMGDAKGNGLVATEAIKLADQAKQGNQEAAQIISKTAQSIQKNSQDSITATSNLINTFNLATKNEVGKRISNVTTRSNVSQLANFIESLEGQKFADASSGVLLSMMADEMAAYQNSFYLNALGAKGDFKDGTNPKIYGAILGYDRMIDDLLIGGYFSYTNSQTENIELDSNIYELGLYSRYFLDNNEFDFNIAGGYGKNDLSYTQNIFGINKILQSNFNSSYIALGLDYGYRFAINDNASIKPYIGADYLYSKTQNYTLKDEAGKDFQEVQSNTVKNLKANLGLEMVKNFDEISIYADAKIKRDLINDEGFTRSSFAGSSAGFNIQGSDKKHTNFAIDTGIVYNATKNLSINLNLGADVNSDDKIYSTSFGAAYKF